MSATRWPCVAGLSRPRLKRYWPLTVLALLGARVPATLTVFLTALAIFDDLGVSLVIVLFYPERLTMPSLIRAAFGVVALVVFNRFWATPAGRQPGHC